MKKFIAGFIVGGVLFGAVGAFADGGQMLEVFYGVKDIKINKVSKMPSGEQPFIYNGTTFVPLRFVAEALGQPVSWDAKNQTVLIGETEQATDVYPGNGIESMSFVMEVT